MAALSASSIPSFYRFASEAACLAECAVNREVPPGCFTSPPTDCGVDCVASFQQDEGCYQCCCQENPGESMH